MSVPISNVTRRVVFTASGTGPYSFTFEILANTDIAVYKDDTLLTLTTDYTVTINSNGTGSITLTASPTGATQIAIVGNRTIQRTTDFVTGGDFFANTVNDEMDQQTIFAQQNAEAIDRALKAPQTDPTSINMTLPRASLRANKSLAFDSDGNPAVGEQIGDFRGNWASGTAYNKRDLIKDTSNGNIYYCSTAHTSSGSQPISTNTDSAKWTLVVDAASATASAAAAAASETAAAASETDASASAALANDWATKTSGAVAGGEYSAKYHAQAASTSASSASSAQSAAESARDATLAAYDQFDDRYLGSKTSDPSVDNDGNALVAGSLYYNSTSQVMRIYTGSAWVAAYVSGTGFVATSDIGVTVQAYDADLTTWAGKTAPSGTVVGTSDTQTLTAKTIEAGTFTNGYTEEVYALGTSGSIALNPANGSIQTCALTGNPTFTDSLAAGQSVVVMLTNGSSYTVTFPTMTWVGPTGNVAPTLNSANVLVFWKVGSTLYGAHVGKY